MQDRLKSREAQYRIDRQRIENARNGSEDTLAELLEACRPYLLKVANGKVDSDLRPKVPPSDLVQRSIIAAAKDFATFQGEDERALFAWLSKILSNRVQEAVRKFKSQKRNIDNERLLDACRELADELANPSSTPSALLMAQEEEERLQKAIGRLSEKYRRIIFLKCWEGKKLKEIGAELGISEDAAGKQWATAVKKLREELEKDHEAG